MNLFDIVAQSGEFLYGLLAALLIGAYQVALAWVHLFNEQRKSSAYLTRPQAQLNGQDSMPPAGTLLGAGVRITLESIPSLIQQEIDELRRNWRTRLDRRLRITQVMSDVAGGIGLLGTVWGMYLTFFQGAADKTTILTGMGVALSTTLVGLAVSILLTLSASFVEGRIASFEERVSGWLLELRQQLLSKERAAPEASAATVEKKTVA